MLALLVKECHQVRQLHHFPWYRSISHVGESEDIIGYIAVLDARVVWWLGTVTGFGFGFQGSWCGIGVERLAIREWGAECRIEGLGIGLRSEQR